MTKVVIHPAGRQAQAKRNWANTIERPVDLNGSGLRDALTGREWQQIAAAHPDGVARVWGTHHGNGNLVAGVRPGDLVIFTAASRLKGVARVGVVLENGALADRLWPPDPERGSYRHVYTIEGMHFVDGVSYDDVRRAGHLGPSYPFRNFAVLDDDRAARLLQAYGRLAPVDVARPRPRTPPLEYVERPDRETPADGVGEGSDAAPPPGVVDVAAHIDGFDGPTDAVVIVRARREQARLRRVLGLDAKAYQGRCGLCGRFFPSGLLVAAHIKRRSDCSEEERRDMPHIAMLACVLGCDALFESGYLTVDDRGRMVSASSSLTHPELHSVLRRLSGSRAPAWTEAREPYFAWHREHRFIGESSVR